LESGIYPLDFISSKLEEACGDRSLYPKDKVKDILQWKKDGLLKYANKESGRKIWKPLFII